MDQPGTAVKAPGRPQCLSDTVMRQFQERLAPLGADHPDGAGERCRQVVAMFQRASTWARLAGGDLRVSPARVRSEVSGMRLALAAAPPE